MSQRPKLVKELLAPGGLIPKLEFRLRRLGDRSLAPVTAGELRHLFELVEAMAERYTELRNLLDPGEDILSALESARSDEGDPEVN